MGDRLIDVFNDHTFIDNLSWQVRDQAGMCFSDLALGTC
jgi:hypothetical protein